MESTTTELAPASLAAGTEDTTDMTATTPDTDSHSQTRNKRDRSTPSPKSKETTSPPGKRMKKEDNDKDITDKAQQQSQADSNESDSDKDSLFGSPIHTTQECYICLERFRERRGEGRIVRPCEHLFCAECWVLWANHLQGWMRVEIRCPTCRRLVAGVDDWFEY